ncbi:VOC family protein [Algoriphagus sp.]
MENDLKIPENYQAVMPYLILKGAVTFIDFAEQVLDAKLLMKEVRDNNTLMHGEIKIGESTVMIAEATEDYAPQPAGLFVYVHDADKACGKAVSLGAELILEVSDKPYGRSGGIKDPFGNTWWITSVH